jgi:hypothetical protein
VFIHFVLSPAFFVIAGCQSTLPAAMIQAKYSKLFRRRLRWLLAELKIALFYGGENWFSPAFWRLTEANPALNFW